MHNDAEITEHYCKKHECNLLQQNCPNCEDGYSHHDCGEDCCPCAVPENNIICDWCNGKGFSRWCSLSTERNPCFEKDWDIDTVDYYEMQWGGDR